MQEKFIIEDNKKLDNNILLIDLKNELLKAFGNILDNILLFGSRIDGTAREYSDYDILIILLSDFNSSIESNIKKICYDISLKYDIIIDAKIISKPQLNTIRGKQPFIQKAIESGITV